MDQQAVLGLVVSLQLRSAIAQQNVTRLERMLRRRNRVKRRYAKKK